MVTLEDKLELFKRSIRDKVELEYQEIIDSQNKDLEKLYESRIKSGKEDILRHKKKIIEKGFSEKNEMISKAIGSKKKILVEKKKDMMNQIMKKLELEILNSMKSDQGKELFTRVLEHLILKDSNFKSGGQIFLKRERIDQAKIHISKAIGNEIFEKYEIKELEDTYIEGFIVQDREGKRRVNFTLKNLLEEKKNEVGQFIEDFLEGAEQVGTNSKD